MSATAKGRTISAEHRAKLAEAGRGRPCSEETREKIRAAQAGTTRRPLSVEHKAKLAEAARVDWARRKAVSAGGG